MEFRNVKAADLIHAAKVAKVRLAGGSFGCRRKGPMLVGRTRQGGERYRACIRYERDSKGRFRWRKASLSYLMFGRGAKFTKSAVCWHGHEHFLRALFARRPDATVITSLARYNGREHFEATFEATGWLNIGFGGIPIATSTACDHDERGL